MLSIQDLQEQILLTISAENFSDPSNCDKLNQLTKEKGILDIMKNTIVDKSSSSTSMTRTSTNLVRIILEPPRES